VEDLRPRIVFRFASRVGNVWTRDSRHKGCIRDCQM